MTLDPELAGLMHHIADAGSIAELLADPEGRHRLDAFCGAFVPYRAPDVRVRDADVSGPNGPVPVRIYDGTAPGISGAGAPALVWMHGGGFTVGGLDMREADQLSREVAARSGGLVLSVGYRLAGAGAHFPVAHEDVLAAWSWTVERAVELGADPLTLCLGGADAGGNLAVGAALYLKDSGMHMPAKLVLAYPLVHGEMPPAEDPATAGLPAILRFTDAQCRAMVENYIGGPLLMASSYAMPGHADLTGLPPAAVLVCEYDDLRFSAERLVEGFRADGIPVEYRLEAGATRGYLNHSAGLAIVQRGLQFLAEQVMSGNRNQASAPLAFQ